MGFKTSYKPHTSDTHTHTHIHTAAKPLYHGKRLRLYIKCNLTKKITLGPGRPEKELLTERRNQGGREDSEGP